MKRSLEEKILLALCVAGALGIMPFAVFRFMLGDWLIGLIDSLIVLMVVWIGYYVWSTGSARVPSIILTLSYLSGMVAVNYVSELPLIFWAYPTMGAAFFLLRPVEALWVNSVALLALLPLIIDKYSNIEVAIILITLFLTKIFAFIFARNSLSYQQQLVNKANSDALTGAANRASFEKDVRSAIYLHGRYAQDFSLIMMDIDFFKRVNDDYGHQAGDAVLVELTRCCKGRLREEDKLYRIGGEEFVVLVKNTALLGAVPLAEDLRQLIQQASLLADKTITVSIGVAQYREGEMSKMLLARVDKALYQAKQAGRNQVCVETQLHESDL